MKLGALLLIVLGLCAATGSPAATDPGRVTVRASSGFATFALDRINDGFRATRSALRSDTLVEDARWDPFGGSPSFRVELEAQLTPVFSAGLSYHLDRGAVRHEALKVFSVEAGTGEPAEIESFEEEPRFEAWDVVGTLGLWVPSAPGLNFGLQLGFVRGTYRKDQTHLIDTFTQLPSMEIGSGEWKGSGVVLGAYTGYERPVTADLSIATRIGYRYRRIGRLDGLMSITTWGDQGNSREWEAGPLSDANGHALPMDLSGAYFDIGLTLGFGGKD
jgi:hypothetical protein